MVTNLSARSQDFWGNVVRQTFDGCYSGDSPLVVWKYGSDGTEVPPASRAYGILVRNVGELKGQIADWRASIEGTDQGFHAVEFADRYECHMDSKDPFKDPVGHLVEDSPGTLVLAGAATALVIGGIIAYALSRRR